MNICPIHSYVGKTPVQNNPETPFEKIKRAIEQNDQKEIRGILTEYENDYIETFQPTSDEKRDPLILAISMGKTHLAATRAILGHHRDFNEKTLKHRKERRQPLDFWEFPINANADKRPNPLTFLLSQSPATIQELLPEFLSIPRVFISYPATRALFKSYCNALTQVIKDKEFCKWKDETRIQKLKDKQNVYLKILEKIIPRVKTDKEDIYKCISVSFVTQGIKHTMINRHCFRISPEKLRREILSILHEDTFVEEIVPIFSKDPKSLIVYFSMVDCLANLIGREKCTEDLKNFFFDDPFIKMYIKTHVGCGEQLFDRCIQNIFLSEKTLEPLKKDFSCLKLSKTTSLFIAFCLTTLVNHGLASAVAVKKIEKLMEDEGVSKNIENTLRKFYCKKITPLASNDQKCKICSRISIANN